MGRVLRSEHSAVKAGDHIYGHMPFQEYAVFADPAYLGSDVFRVLENKERLPWSAYVGVCGMPGKSRVLLSSLRKWGPSSRCNDTCADSMILRHPGQFVRTTVGYAIRWSA